MKKSFTLIEVLVVIFIIGFLAATIIVGGTYARRKAKDANRISEVTTIAVGLDKYYLDHGSYPIGDITVLMGVLVPNYIEKSISDASLNYNQVGTPAQLYRVWFEPEFSQNASCNSSSDPTNCSSAKFLIINGKISRQWQ